MIYFDSASTTRLDDEVLNAYHSLLAKSFANSESLYDAGMEMHNLMEKSRASVASFLHVHPSEVYFTSGASESNSAIIKGVAFANREQGRHIITSSVEHSSVMNACRQLEEEFDYEVTYLPVGSDGKVSVSDLEKAIRPDTVLVSIMYVNNESGAIMPIDDIKAVVKKSKAVLHVDCVQALGKLDLDLSDIDCASFSAHKINGLKGSGLMIKKQHIRMLPLINGGQQEMGLRGGTANAAADIVWAKTLRLALEHQASSMKHIHHLNQMLREELSKIEGIHFNSSEEALDTILNFSVSKLTSEVLMNALNAKGICVSAQSTCSSKSTSASHVLLAMGISEEAARKSIRVSLSRENTEEEIRYFVQVLKESIKQYGTNRV